LSIGVLQGKALGIVEICPNQGFYDYHNKYTHGVCDYKAPAELAPTATRSIQTIAEQLFQMVQCQDLARIDFILADDGSAWPLEINTIPGMTEQSLFPKSAACVGIELKALLSRLIEGACKRF
jgi:D-alanine-D-alanine ligase